MDSFSLAYLLTYFGNTPMLCVSVVHYLYCLDVFHCMDIPQFIYAFICCLTFFPGFGYHEQTCRGIWVRPSLCVDICFLFFLKTIEIIIWTILLILLLLWITFSNIRQTLYSLAMLYYLCMLIWIGLTFKKTLMCSCSAGL